MGKRRRYGTSERLTGGPSPHGLDLSIWPQIDEGGLAEGRLKLFLSRKKGVELYLAGESAAEIKSQSGLSRVQIYRLISERCMLTHEDGQLNGWRGLVPHLRMKPYIRTKPLTPDDWGRGTSGALQLLFSTSMGAALEIRFQKKILQQGRSRRLEGQRIPKQDLIVWFLTEARAIYQDKADLHWPFNVAKQGQIPSRPGSGAAAATLCEPMLLQVNG